MQSTAETITPLAPLQLKKHFFSLILLRANAKGTTGAANSLQPIISFQRQADNQWILSLSVFLKSRDQNNPYVYDIEVEIQGLVEISETFKIEKRDQLALVNGFSVLYSAVREMVMNTTARSAHGALCLPTLSFVKLVSSQLPSEKDEQKRTEPPQTSLDPKTS